MATDGPVSASHRSEPTMEYRSIAPRHGKPTDGGPAPKPPALLASAQRRCVWRLRMERLRQNPLSLTARVCSIARKSPLPPAPASSPAHATAAQPPQDQTLSSKTSFHQ